MTWLSILVPVYNVAPYLEECLQSVLDQAGDGVQVLVLDDRSTDGSWELMQQLARRWPGRLQLMRHERNAGLSAARNTMIDAATGDYLWFLDSDDKLLPDAIGALSDIVRQHAPDAVLCDFSVWREAPRLKHRLRGEAHRHSFQGPARQRLQDRGALLAGLLRTGQLHAWSKISRRSLWGADLRFPAGRYFEDMMTMPQMALRCDSFYYCPQPWVAYRQRGDSILASMTASKAVDQSAALEPLARALQGDALRSEGRLQFALACQAARNLIGALRFLRRQQASLPPAQCQALARQFLEDFDRISPLPLQALRQAYGRRGMWLRAWKLRSWERWARQQGEAA
ncbi:MAG: glycosyltransferase [Burkholderiaceae bacterium]|jgi:glycosyltransferase involved in cell wall biosynthesis|nr:glycosyltransferase [Burkholderiaceae bacterium]